MHCSEGLREIEMYYRGFTVSILCNISVLLIGQLSTFVEL